MPYQATAPTDGRDEATNRKDQKFILYNTTLRDGVTYGHLADINYCMDNLIVPNDYRGLVIGIGLPDPRKFFPDFDRKRRKTEPDYTGHFYKCMRNRTPETTYFDRLCTLEMALSGDAPSDEDGGRIAGKGFKAVPYQKIFVTPKYPHQIFTDRYDTVWKNNLQGQLEPPKDLIQSEYLFVRETKGTDGPARDRIKSKDASERNIPLVVVHEHDISPGQLEYRGKTVLSQNQQKELTLKNQNSEFELCIMPYTAFNGQQQEMVGATLNDAYKTQGYREVVFAIPFLPVPKNPEDRQRFWMTHYLEDAGGGPPFKRYERLKQWIGDSFASKPEELGRIHITFVEMNESGEFLIPEKSLSFLPRHFRSHGPFSDYLATLQKVSKQHIRILDLPSPSIFTRKTPPVGCETPPCTI
jgi:hypothetical protein